MNPLKIYHKVYLIEFFVEGCDLESLTVYGLPNCVQCEQVRGYFSRRFVGFDYVDLSSDSAAYEFVRALGFSQAPVIVIGEDSFSGFNPNMLDTIIGKYGLDSSSV